AVIALGMVGRHAALVHLEEVNTAPGKCTREFRTSQQFVKTLGSRAARECRRKSLALAGSLPGELREPPSCLAAQSLKTWEHPQVSLRHSGNNRVAEQRRENRTHPCTSPDRERREPTLTRCPVPLPASAQGPLFTGRIHTLLQLQPLAAVALHERVSLRRTPGARTIRRKTFRAVLFPTLEQRIEQLP